MYVFLAKRENQYGYYFDIYFMGCQTSLKVSKEYYDKCELNTGDYIPSEAIEQTYYKDGYNLVCRLKMK